MYLNNLYCLINDNSCLFFISCTRPLGTTLVISIVVFGD